MKSTLAFFALPTLLIVACDASAPPASSSASAASPSSVVQSASGEPEQLQPLRTRIIEAVDQLVAQPRFEAEIVGHHDPEAGEVTLRGAVQLGDAPLDIRLVLDRRHSDFRALIATWDGPRAVQLSWVGRFFIVEGPSAGEVEIPADSVGDALLDMHVRGLCGYHRVKAHVMVEIGEHTVKGIAQLGVDPVYFAPADAVDMTARLSGGAEVSPAGCTAQSFLFIDWGCKGGCKYVEQLEDATQDVCLKVRASLTGGALKLPGVTVPAGGGQISAGYENRTHTQSLFCWATFTGKCIHQDSWIDHCSCVAQGAPEVDCLAQGSCVDAGTSCAEATSCN